ncbi:MAG: hypothetical protein AAGL17_23645, partial [Cyanobacteria bacterium J06576_12]
MDKDKGIVLSTHLPLSASITEPLAARELTFAITQLEHLPANQTDLVTNSLLADLLFLQGRSLHQQGDLARARSYYEKSLVHWQLEAADHPIHTTKLTTKSGSLKKVHRLHSQDKQAVLKFHLGLWWRTQATFKKDSTAAYQQARAYFESCLTIFRQQNRADRVGRFILALADVVQKLEDWPALVQIAKESTRLHHNDPARLARDYGYLAEAALAYYLEAQSQGKAQPEQLSKAQGFAQQALETSEQLLAQFGLASDFAPEMLESDVFEAEMLASGGPERVATEDRDDAIARLAGLSDAQPDAQSVSQSISQLDQPPDKQPNKQSNEHATAKTSDKPLTEKTLA